MMEGLSEREKEVLFNEINQIKKVLFSHQNEEGVQVCTSDEDSDDYEYLEENVSENEIEEDGDALYLNFTKTYSPWQTHVLSEDESADDAGDYDNDSENLVVNTTSILNRAQHATIQQERGLLSSVSYSTADILPVRQWKTASNDMPSSSLASSGKGLESGGFSLSLEHHAGVVDSSTNIGSFEWALQLNRDYQEIIKDELIRINCALANNRNLQDEVENRQKGCKNPQLLGYSFFARFKPTYLKDRFGEGPPPNQDAKDREDIRKIHPYFNVQKLWKGKERKSLAEGVRNQNLERLTLGLKEKLNNLKKKTKESKDGKTSDIEREIKETEKKMDDLKDISSKELEMNIEGLDFDSISRLYLPKRQEKECRIRWLNVEHPSINQSKWTQEEDTKLVSLALKYDKRYWEQIAQELGTFRTPVQCCQRYQRSLNKDLLKKNWTKSEDKELIAAVNACPKGNWVAVSDMMDGRAPMQCFNRYEKSVRPGLKKGPWTEEENSLLVKYCELYGPGNWKKISAHIPGRLDVACRERWVNFYDPELKLRRKWTKKEDILLMRAVNRYGIGKWTQISKDVPGRSDSMCSRRWNSIDTKESEKYREKLLLRRELLGYFVHRNHEIPNVDLEKLDLSTKGSKGKGNRKRKLTSSKKTNAEKDTEKALEQIETAPKTIKGNCSKKKLVGTSCVENPDNNSKASYSNDDDSEDIVSNADFESEEEESEIKKGKLDEDPDYRVDDEALEDSNDEEDFEDFLCANILEAGERLLGRHEAGVASYLDVKRELFLLKLQIQKLENSEEKSRLIRLNEDHFRELEEMRDIKMMKKLEGRSKFKRNTVTRPCVDIKDTIEGPENIGIRPMRPVAVGNMPGNLAAFTILLEVFQVDYPTIMKRMQENAKASSAATSTNTPSSSNAARNESQSKTKQANSQNNNAPSIPQIVPIAPNLVTLRAFRKLLLHRQKLLELASKIKHPEIADSSLDCNTDVTSVIDTDDINCSSKVSVRPSNSSNASANANALNKASSEFSYRNTQDYATACARFKSLFLWPALLSAHAARIPDVSKSRRSLLTTTTRFKDAHRKGCSTEAAATGNVESIAGTTSQIIATAATGDTVGTAAYAGQRNEMMWNRVIRSNVVSTVEKEEAVSQRKRKRRKQQTPASRDIVVLMKESCQDSEEIVACPHEKEKEQLLREKGGGKKAKHSKNLKPTRRKSLIETQSSDDTDSDGDDPDFHVDSKECQGSVGLGKLDKAVSIGKDSLRRSNRISSKSFNFES